MSSDLIHAALQERIADDLDPVRPIQPVWRRTLMVAVVATLVMAVTVFGLKLQLRSDMDMLPVWLGWGCTLLELLVGVLIIGLALRESVPGSSQPMGLVRTAVATGLAIQILVGITTWMHSPGMPIGSDWFAKSVGCLAHDTTLVLPTLIITLWLVFRALPLRAPMAGLLGGVGAAITGDAVTHLLCPMSDLRHVLVWHTGAIFGFMALGWAVGLLWERIRWRT
jgi:hypothetical protein